MMTGDIIILIEMLLALLLIVGIIDTFLILNLSIYKHCISIHLFKLSLRSSIEDVSTAPKFIRINSVALQNVSLKINILPLLKRASMYDHIIISRNSAPGNIMEKYENMNSILFITVYSSVICST